MANHSLPTMTPPSYPAIQILPATADDYKGVLAISSEIHKRVDYLPQTYHAWLKDPQRRMFVAKLEGKVVAFESFLLVDGGVTAVYQGLRVATWMRGCRVAGLMQKYLAHILRLDHPDVTRIRLARVEDPPAILLNKYRIIHSKAVMGAYISANELEEVIRVLELRVSTECKNIPPPVFLDYSEVHGLFSGPLKEDDLLPGGFFIQAWLPVTTCKANLDLMQRWRVQWLCSYPRDAVRQVTGLTKLSAVMTNGMITNGIYASKDNVSVCGTGPSATAFKGFLSLVAPMFPVPLDGMHRLDIDMFGTDLSCAKIHVLYQLKKAVKILPPGDGIVYILHAEESLRDGLTRLLDGFTPFHWNREQLVLEMNVKDMKSPPIYLIS